VSRRPGLADGGRRAPPADWEAFFLIGIFPAGVGLRWCKVQLFSGAPAAGGHCVSSVEGIDGEGNFTLLRGYADRVERIVRPLRPGELQVAAEGWDVRAPGVGWSGELPALTLAIEEPAAVAETGAGTGTGTGNGAGTGNGTGTGTGTGAGTGTDQVISWVRLGRALTYWSAPGRLLWRDAGGEARGLGLVEHAWGAAIRLDLGRIGWPWHWDVLSFEDGSYCAGLALGALGNLRGFQGGGRIGAGPARRMSGLKVRVEAWEKAEGRAVPARWKGAMRLGDGVLRYEARACTPVAAVVPDGGFLGFACEGEWQEAGKSARGMRGTGFCEYRARRR
jgi:hypothetical protein